VRRSRSAWLAVLGLSALLGACSKKAPATQRGVDLDPNRTRTRAAVPAKEEPKEAQAPEPLARGRKLKSPFELGPGDLMADSNAPKSAEPAEPEQPADQRDLGRELSDMLTAPGCMDLAAAAKQPGGRLTISGSAYVMASGRITSATVTAPGQPATALRCAEARLQSQGLKGPVPGGAQSVSGTATIEVAVAQPAAPPQQQQAAPVQDRVPPLGPTNAPSLGNYGVPTEPRKPEMAGRSSNYGLEGSHPDQMAGPP
jgi:hypothetical protein